MTRLLLIQNKKPVISAIYAQYLPRIAAWLLYYTGGEIFAAAVAIAVVV
jgi:hypothetical protein